VSTSLELRGVAQRFGDTQALAAVDLAVPAGSYVVLLGPSGSGKTTLLSILGGFLVPTAGAVLIDGADVTAVPPARRPTATVFQDYALFPHLSVAGNVGFGLAMQRVPRGERQRRIDAVLDLVGLAGYGGRRVHALSGGQRQRVALARALAVEPAVLLLDEPLGALDVALRRQVQAELKALQRRVGTTFVHVTHDQEEAMALADLLVVMNGGRIEDQGPPDRVYLRPRTRFTATFLGDSNLIEGRIADAGEGWVLVETGLGAVRARGEGRVGAATTLSLRPEQIHACEGAWALGDATISDAMFLGSHWRVEVAMPTAGRHLTLHLPPARAPRVGERLALGADPASAAVLAG
jgi:spermidine/putrescine transport system ATP-binding protein